jgi:hypothetical protein
VDARGARLEPQAPSRLRARELLLAALAGCLLAAVSHWPLPLHLGSQVERDVGDPIVQAWQVAWGGHALAHQPLDYFQANTFFPLPDSLAFSDALAGYAPAGLFGSGVTGAIARYNLLFLFAYALAFLGAYLLARELSLRPAAAAVAGAAFAYAPWRLQQDGHLHVLSSGGIPLALFLLLRGYRRGSARMVLAGWLVAAWQLSLGFTLGLQLGYLLGALGLIALIGWWAAGRPPLRAPRNVAIATVAGVALLAVTAIVLARPYQRVLDDHPEAHRSAERLSDASGPVAQFASAPDENLIWGGATAGLRDDLTSVPEQTLFPGLLILALAIVGLVSQVFPMRLRVGLGLGVLGCAVLSLGFHRHGFGALYPYRALYELAPGWQGVRVPARINTLTSLGLALLAAAGASRLLSILGRRRLAVGVASALLVVAVCAEGSAFFPSHPKVPTAPAGQRAVAAPALHLPITIPANRRYVLWSTGGFPKIVNGRGSFDPALFEQLTAQVLGFPDRPSVARLRALGVRSVVLHENLVAGTPWASTGERSVAGLGVDVERQPGVVVYRL